MEQISNDNRSTNFCHLTNCAIVCIKYQNTLRNNLDRLDMISEWVGIVEISVSCNHEFKYVPSVFNHYFSNSMPKVSEELWLPDSSGCHFESFCIHWLRIIPIERCIQWKQLNKSTQRGSHPRFLAHEFWQKNVSIIFYAFNLNVHWSHVMW